MQPEIPTETAVRVYKRYLRLEPMHTEEYIAYLKSKAGHQASNLCVTDNMSMHAAIAFGCYAQLSYWLMHTINPM